MRRGVAKALIASGVVAAVVVGGAFGLHALWASTSTSFASDSCTVGAYELTPDQAAVAATMAGAATKYRVRLPERATVLAIAAALQESKLTNLAPGSGDRDSVGVLQQRPSQGWGGGNAARLTDVGEATKEFLDALVKVANWQRLPLAEAVQDVQISADGSAYAQHEPEAQALADALLGRRPAAISCSFAAPTLVAKPAVVARQVSAELGTATPAIASNGVRVPGAGWQTAAWFVANAERLGIERVGYAGRQWTRTGGWATVTAAAGSTPRATVTATMYRT